MAGDDLPSWAIRLREERVRRLWSQKVMAVCLRNAADEQTQDRLPPRVSIQRYVRDYEAGRHFPGDLYAELYCRAFGLTRDALFDGKSGGRSDEPRPEQVPTEQEASSLVNWIATNTSDDAIEHIARETGELAETHTRRGIWTRRRANWPLSWHSIRRFAWPRWSRTPLRWTGDCGSDVFGATL
jgi:hypothetical protein